jgi:alpha-ketoglutarate-dependent 2,4-dichlorophenoxyacetate dioxygenase
MGAIAPGIAAASQTQSARPRRAPQLIEHVPGAATTYTRPVAITVTPLAPCFAARIDGADITRPLDDATWAEIRAAFEEHSVLVVRGQHLDDERQVAFSLRFGPLEVTRSLNPAAGTPFARQSNLDLATGEVIPADDRRMTYQLANMLWHSDSSFKPVPSLCSLLSGRIVPPEGGATEFASARAAYPTLPEALRRRLEQAVIVHDAWSRDQVRPGFFTRAERGVYPPVRHPMVRTNPVNGRRSLFLGAHASHIEGLPVEEGRALLKAVLDHVTQPVFRYRHEWQTDDLVIWDNRCVLHRATPYDTVRHKRLMQRTTISGDPAEYTVPAPMAARA